MFLQGLQVISSGLRLKFEITALQVEICSKKSIFFLCFCFDVTCFLPIPSYLLHFIPLFKELIFKNLLSELCS